MVRKNLMNIINGETTIDIPEDLEVFVRRNILDAMGCALAGVQTELARQVIDKAAEAEVLQESTVIGDGGKISADMAYMTNAILARLEVHDKKTCMVPRHPGQPLLFAGLSAGEQLGLDLKTVIGAIVVAHELILRVGRSVSPIAWPEYELIPKIGMESCFTLQGLAGIVETVVKEHVGEEGGDVFTRLLLKILDFVQSPRSQDYSALSGNGEIIGHCREHISRIKFSKTAFCSCLVRKVGFQFSYLDHFMEAPTRAMIKDMRNKKVLPDRIERILFKGFLWLDAFIKDPDRDIKERMAYTAYLCIGGVDPYNAWYLNGLTGRPEMPELTKKVLLVEDFWDLQYNVESGKYRCMVQINHADGEPLVGKLIHDLYDIRCFRNRDRSEDRFKKDAIGMIGYKQTENLSRAIISENMKVAEMMKLTYPRRWPAVVTRKWGWLIKN